jgi:hypothetical protein
MTPGLTNRARTLAEARKESDHADRPYPDRGDHCRIALMGAHADTVFCAIRPDSSGRCGRAVCDLAHPATAATPGNPLKSNATLGTS